jgi:plasmid stabilization system protein ParE
VRLERHAAVIAEDLPLIYASVARDNPAAAERVLDAVEATFEQLTRQRLD